MKKRVAIVVSHPIQHFTPLYRVLARQPDVELKVFFCSRVGLEPYFDREFGMEFKWETDLLAGYDHEFLDNAENVKAITFLDVRSPDLGRRLNRFKPDVVQVYGYAQLIALQAMLWAKLHSVPVLLMSDSELVHARPLKVRVAKRLVLPALYRAVRGFLTIGDNNEAYLRHYGVKQPKMFRSPYPTNDDHFLATRENLDEVRRETRQRLAIPDDAFVSLFVGKLIDRKRPADLLEATRLAAARSGKRFVAVFVGDGSLKPALERDLRDRGAECARLIGFVNQPELPSMYAAADALVHPADNDPHPIAVTEGVLMGLPVVVSDKVGSAGPTDTVRVNQNGFVFPVGDIPAFAAALVRLASSAELRRQMGDASRKIASEMDVRASIRGYVAAVNALAHASA